MKYRAPLLALLAVLLLGVGWWYLLQQPKIEERQTVEADTSRLESQEAQLRGQIAELERVRDNEMVLRAELALMEEYIPNGVAQPVALRELQDVEDAAGVNIETMAWGSPVAVEGAPDTGEPATTLAQVSLSMSVEGGYFQLVDLLRRLEVDVPRAVLIESITMTEGGEGGFPTLSTSLSGRMFAVVDVASTVDPEDGDPPSDDEDDEDGASS